MWGGRSIAVLFINSQLSSKTSKFCPKADLFSHRLVTEGCRSKLFSKEGGGGGRVEVVVKALVSSHAVSHPRPSAWSWSKGFSSSSPLYLTPYNKINISKLVFNLGSKNSIRCLLVIWLKNKLPYLVPILLTTCSHYWLNRKVIGPTSVGRTWSMPALLTKKKKKTCISHSYSPGIKYNNTFLSQGYCCYCYLCSCTCVKKGYWKRCRKALQRNRKNGRAKMHNRTKLPRGSLQLELSVARLHHWIADLSVS